MCEDGDDREEDMDKGEREERRNGDMNDNIEEQKSDVSQGVEERQEVTRNRGGIESEEEEDILENKDGGDTSIVGLDETQIEWQRMKNMSCNIM